VQPRRAAACLQDIARTNRLTFAYRPLIGWLSRLTAEFAPLAAPLRILDIGCGYGDGLRRVERWARRRRIPVELVGLDLNPDATALAEEATAASSRIQWVTANVLSYTPPQAPHLIISSLFTHHLNEEADRPVSALDGRPRAAGLVYQRPEPSTIPYHFFRAFARVARLHHFVRNDGPVSIARSFIAGEWRTMCGAAELDMESIEIRPFKPARLCVSRRKP